MQQAILPAQLYNVGPRNKLVMAPHARGVRNYHMKYELYFKC